MKEKKIADEKSRNQGEKVIEIAFLQSHQVRKPIANILGLINLFNVDNPLDPVNLEVILGVKIAATELDNIIHQIVKKIEEIKKLK